jgi:hypothetical protein
MNSLNKKCAACEKEVPDESLVCPACGCGKFQISKKDIHVQLNHEVERTEENFKQKKCSSKNKFERVLALCDLCDAEILRWRGFIYSEPVKGKSKIYSMKDDRGRPVTVVELYKNKKLLCRKCAKKMKGSSKLGGLWWWLTHICGTDTWEIGVDLLKSLGLYCLFFVIAVILFFGIILVLK